MPDPLIAPLVGESPFLALVQQRMSTRTDEALVFVTPGGAYRSAIPRAHRSRASGRRVRLAQVLARDFAQVYWVRLAEQALAFSVRLPCQDERTVVTAELQLVARVHDPDLVVEQRIIDPEPYVRANVQAQMRDMTIEHTVDTLPEAERQIGYVLSRAEPFRLPELGMSYGPGHVRFRLDGAPLGAAGVESHPRFAAPITSAGFDGTGELGAPLVGDPAPWLHLRRQELEFYKDLVQDGPRSLIAFWLREHPESIKDILEWVSRNQEPHESPDGALGPVDNAPGPSDSAPSTPGLEDAAEAELQQAMRAILSRGGYTAGELRAVMEELGE